MSFSKKVIISIILFCLFSNISFAEDLPHTVGVGGGGAMFSFSISPYSDIWFIGTDMGQAYRSIDQGFSWKTIDQFEFEYGAKEYNYSYFGFLPDKKTVFGAGKNGCIPKVSKDSGETWILMGNLDSFIPQGYKHADCKKNYNKIRIRYFLSDSKNGKTVISAMGDGLIMSYDAGETWTKINNITGDSKGSFYDYSTNPHTIYHATDNGIYKSNDGGKTFFKFLDNVTVKSFAGGKDSDGTTLSYIEEIDANENGTNYKKGILKISKDEGKTWNTKLEDGYQHIRLAENNSKIMYLTGDREMKVNKNGTKIRKSEDVGETWNLIFYQNGKVPDSLEKSAVGLDIGYWDGGYRSFAINRRNSDIFGGTGNFFLHTSLDGGKTFKSPFTKFEGSGERVSGKNWSSNGLEPTSSYLLKFHPNNPKLGYSGFADIKGITTEDGGKTWRLLNGEKIGGGKHKFNSFYDFAFIPNNENIVYAVGNGFHDFPRMWYVDPMINTESKISSIGGVFKSEDKGRTWSRLTPENFEYNMGFLSIAYDSKNNILYAGSHGRGIARSTDGGKTWEWINNGLASESGFGKVISQIELDPKSGDVYAMLAGDRFFRNHIKEANGDKEKLKELSNLGYAGLYKLDFGTSEWKFLRGNIERGKINEKYELWPMPLYFAVDWNDKDRNTIFVSDHTIAGERKSTGIWKTTNGGANWIRKRQLDFANRITINSKNSDEIHFNGKSRNKESGSFYSKDSGETWEVNESLPIKLNYTSTIIDPNDSSKLFYTTFGAGIRYAKNPAYNFNKDTVSPIITLNGESKITVNIGENFTDPGAICKDETDLICEVVIGGDNVDINKAGTYIITYDSVDKSLNKAIQKVRKVEVIISNKSTYYIREDGGTAEQCNGKFDIPLSNDKNCAWNHPFEAFGVNNSSEHSANVVGGDTVIIKEGSYKMGYDKDKYYEGSCSKDWTYNCVMAPIPSGTALNPTRILGEGWNDNSGKMPELYGVYRAKNIIDLSNSSYVEIQNLEIKDHETCGHNYHNKTDGTELSCDRINHENGGADIGIVSVPQNGKSNTSKNVLLKNLYVHGIASQGLKFGGVGDWTIEDSKFNYNGTAGIDGDSNTTDELNKFNGTITIKNTEINYNGCIEEWQNDGQIPDKGCYGKGTDGGLYGDGIGFGAIGNVSWIFDGIEVKHNTSDGIDFLHAEPDDDTSLILKNSILEGNAGNQLKIDLDTYVYNNKIIGNCDYFKGKNITLESGITHCRGGGATIIVASPYCENTYIVNNTISATASDMIELNAQNKSGIGKTYVVNNILDAQPKYNNSSVGSDYYYIYNTFGTKLEFSKSNTYRAYNLYNGTSVKRYEQCSETGSICDKDPLLTANDAATEDYDFTISSASSPAVNAGLLEGTVIFNSSIFGDIKIPNVDFVDNTRVNADMGTYEYKESNVNNGNNSNKKIKGGGSSSINVKKLSKKSYSGNERIMNGNTKKEAKKVYQILFKYFDKKFKVVFLGKDGKKYEVRKLNIGNYYLLFNEKKDLYYRLFKKPYCIIKYIKLEKNKKIFMKKYMK